MKRRGPQLPSSQLSFRDVVRRGKIAEPRKKNEGKDDTIRLRKVEPLQQLGFFRRITTDMVVTAVENVLQPVLHDSQNIAKIVGSYVDLTIYDAFELIEWLIGLRERRIRYKRCRITHEYEVVMQNTLRIGGGGGGGGLVYSVAEEKGGIKESKTVDKMFITLKRELESAKLAGDDLQRDEERRLGLVLPILFKITQITKNIRIKRGRAEQGPISRIPPGIRLLKNLSVLSLKDTAIQEIPNEIGELRQLKKLAVDGGKLQCVPREIAFLKESLTQLSFSRNSFQGIPHTLRALKNLKELSMRKNRVREIPPWIWEDLEELEGLDVSNCLIDELPASLSRLKWLRVINASNNLIYKIPESLADSNLKYLNLMNCKIDRFSVPEKVVRAAQASVDAGFVVKNVPPKGRMNLYLYGNAGFYPLLRLFGSCVDGTIVQIHSALNHQARGASAF